MKLYAVSCGPLSGTHLLTLVEPAKDTDVRPSVVEPVVNGAASAVVGQRYWLSPVYKKLYIVALGT